MHEVKSVKFKILTDGERLNLVKRTLDHTESITDDHCSIIPEFHTSLTQHSLQLNQAMGEVTTNDLTRKINEVDAVRDDAIDFIDDTISLMLKKRNPRHRESAKLMREIFDCSFAGINMRNNNEESVGIDLFLNAINNADAEAAIIILRITDEITTLRESQPNYVSLLSERSTLRETDTTPLLVPTRNELRRELRALESFINFKVRRGSEIHISLAQDINAVISEIEPIALARETRNENRTNAENESILL